MTDTSDGQIDLIRERATEWRERFEQAENINGPRIETLKEQIATLGPEPAEGEEEAEDVASRRERLNEQLAELQAPAVRATEAFSRAEALVMHADEIERMREAREILAETASPLMPTSWAAAAEDFRATVSGVADEAGSMWADRGRIESVPRLMLFLLAAAGLIYARQLVEFLPSWLGSRTRGDARAVVAFLVSLAQISVPMIGIFLFAYALDATGLFGQWTTPLLLSMPLAGLVFFSGRWLVSVAFASTAVAYDTLNLPPKQRNLARYYGTGLAVVTAIHAWLANSMLPLSGFVRRDNAPPLIPYEVSQAGAGVVHFILLLAGAFFMFQLANILRRLTKYDGSDLAALAGAFPVLLGRFLRLLWSRS